MDQSFAIFAFALLTLVTVAAAPVWPWSRRMGPRPMIVSAICVLLFVLLAVWTADS